MCFHVCDYISLWVMSLNKVGWASVKIVKFDADGLNREQVFKSIGGVLRMCNSMHLCTKAGNSSRSATPKDLANPDTGLGMQRLAKKARGEKPDNALTTQLCEQLKTGMRSQCKCVSTCATI